MPFWTRNAPPEPPPATPPKVVPPTPPPAAPAAPSTAVLSCSFCGKSQREVKKLIAGVNVYICDECVGICNDILAEDTKASLPQPPASALSWVEALEREVVGQPLACRAVAAALFRHLKGIHAEQPHGPVRILLVGPRGCGKTTLAKALCKPGFTGLPAYHADAGRMSETGYIGENVENIVGALLSRSVDDEIGRRGILFFDSLHHLVRQIPYPNARDIAGREAQRDLVRLLDGLEIVAVRQGKRHPQAPADPVVCDRLMIAAAATFDVTATDEVSLRAELEGLGLVDEMLARFDVIVAMRSLGVAELGVVLDRQVSALRPVLEAVGAGVELGDGAVLLAERAAASVDGAFALLPPLSRLRERALLEPPRTWIVDRALAAELVLSRSPA